MLECKTNITCSLQRLRRHNMKRKKESNKIYKQHFFEKISENEYKCRLCQKMRTAKKGTGSSNLMEHLRSQHKDFEHLLRDHPDSSTLPVYLDKRALNMYSWLDWIISDGLCFSTVEKASYRKYSNLEDITTDTFMKYMKELTAEVELEIKQLLPNKFSLIFDGWTLEGTSTHFIAMFARFLVCLTFPFCEFLVNLMSSCCFISLFFSHRSIWVLLEQHFWPFNLCLMKVISLLHRTMNLSRIFLKMCSNDLGTMSSVCLGIIVLRTRLWLIWLGNLSWVAMLIDLILKYKIISLPTKLYWLRYTLFSPASSHSMLTPLCLFIFIRLMHCMSNLEL